MLSIINYYRCNVLYSTVLYCTILYRPIHRYPFSWRIYLNHHSDNFINKHLVFVCRQRALYECVYINSIIINVTYLVLSYIVFFYIVCNGIWKFYGYEFWGVTNCFSRNTENLFVYSLYWHLPVPVSSSHQMFAEISTLEYQERSRMERKKWSKEMTFVFSLRTKRYSWLDLIYCILANIRLLLSLVTIRWLTVHSNSKSLLK